jgi:hypothetical protein
MAPVFWIRADRGVTLDGSDVAQWDDQIGTAHFAQATPAIRPSFSAAGGPGGMPAVQFTKASTECMTTAAFTFPAVQFVCAALVVSSTAANQTLVSAPAVKNYCELERGGN